MADPKARLLPVAIALAVIVRRNSRADTTSYVAHFRTSGPGLVCPDLRVSLHHVIRCLANVVADNLNAAFPCRHLHGGFRCHLLSGRCCRHPEAAADGRIDFLRVAQEVRGPQCEISDLVPDWFHWFPGPSTRIVAPVFLFSFRVPWNSASANAISTATSGSIFCSGAALLTRPDETFRILEGHQMPLAPCQQRTAAVMDPPRGPAD